LIVALFKIPHCRQAARRYAQGMALLFQGQSFLNSKGT
jgi:hypothetical protein